VFIQVKTAQEDSKFGLPPEQLLSFLTQLKNLDTLQPVGLMTMATQTDDQTEVRRCFAQLRQLRDQALEAVLTQYNACRWHERDFELAIAEAPPTYASARVVWGTWLSWRSYGTR